MILTVYGGIFVFLLLTSAEQESKDILENCTEWKLSGGSYKYEGRVEVKYNQTWVNICADSFTDTDAIKICQKIFKPIGQSVDKVTTHEQNVYKAVEQSRRISYTMCGNHSQEEKNPTTMCQKVASLCCYDLSTAPCSTNWSSKLEEEETLYFTKNNKQQLRYDQLLKVNFTENVTKSWTKSALEEQTCETNESLIVVVKNCLKRCRVTSDLIFILSCADNTPCCINDSHMQQTENSSVRNLTIVNGPTDNVTYCLAAEVINGSVYVSIENCGWFFKAFLVSNHKVPPDPTTTATAAINGDNSASNDKVTTQPVSDLPVKTILIAVAVGISLLVTVCVVFAIVVCWKLKNNGQTKEQQRPNSVANRAYATEGFHTLHQDEDEEEYTLISDMEIEHQSPEPYKPPVPDRGSDTSKDKEIEIITLAEYSLPSDNVRVGYKVSQTSDYCMTTYDDPIRLKFKEEHKQKGDSDCIENCSPDSNGQRSTKRGHKTNSKNLDRNSRNSQVSDRNSRNSQMSSINRNSATADVRNDSQRTTALLEVKHTEDRHDTSETGKTKHIKQNEDAYEDCGIRLEQKRGAEILDNLVIPETQSEENDIKENLADDSDYEDTNIIDGNFTNKCSSPFEEHVCLDCLKPEHLTRLGIKIISDDMYEKSQNFRRSVSDPSCRVYYNKVEIDDDKEEKVKLQDNRKHVQDRVENEEDSLIDLNVVRRKKTTATEKRCSVCHTVYDKLGNTQQNAWANCTDNVYDQFGNFKHFKHRGQICGKRMNSS